MFSIIGRCQQSFLLFGKDSTEVYTETEVERLGLPRASLWRVVAFAEDDWTTPMTDGLITAVVYAKRRLVVIVKTENVHRVSSHFERLMWALRPTILEGDVDMSVDILTRFVGEYKSCHTKLLKPVEFVEIAADALPF
jgi:hypothetical protein